MAPEQLAGRSVSVKSDLYSLGLVLAEMFTGKRVFEDAPRAGRSRGTAPTSLATSTDDLDPVVERVILRCLEPDPPSRPSSALAVAAALPGGDPLAAALAAGETPSPEMVANAGEAGGLRPAVAIACVIAILGGMFALVPLTRSKWLTRQIALPKPPAVLADRAATILKNLGHTGAVVDSAYSFFHGTGYLRQTESIDKSAHRWGKLAHVRPSPVGFWYRTSPRVLIPAVGSDGVSDSDPAMDVSGMALVSLDPLGRLLRLTVVPPEHELESVDASVRKPTDWSVVFREAEFDPASFTAADPLWTPSNHCDERAAWEGRLPEQPDVPLRIEAGAYRGKIIAMRIVAPWTKASRMEELPQTLGERVEVVIVMCVLFCLLAGGALLARRNLTLRRCDRTGADRLALVCFCLLVVSWLLQIEHVSDLVGEVYRLQTQAGKALLAVAIIWLWYIALEPYVRRSWPQVLIGWSRLLSGRFQDPLVGRDILFGAIGALAAIYIGLLEPMGRALLGQPPVTPDFPSPGYLSGFLFQIGNSLDVTFLFFSFLYLFLLLGLRLLLRRVWLVCVVVVGLQSILEFASFRGGDSVAATTLHLVIGSLQMCVHLFVMLHLGLLANASLCYFGFGVIDVPAAFGLTGWQAQPSWTAIVFVTALTLYGCHTAIAGRPLFRDELLQT
jgi:serine/threonine-protein kinase